MGITGIGGQTNPYVSQKKQSSNSADSLQRQREVLTKQLEEVKSRPKNSQAEQNAAVAQKKILEKQISAIEQKIQKILQSKDSESSVNTNLTSLQAAAESENQIPLSLKETGRLFDIYV